MKPLLKPLLKPLAAIPIWQETITPYYSHFQELRAYRRLIMKIRTKEPLSHELCEFVVKHFLPALSPPPELHIFTSVTNARYQYGEFENLYLKWKYPT